MADFDSSGGRGRPWISLPRGPHFGTGGLVRGQKSSPFGNFAADAGGSCKAEPVLCYLAWLAEGVGIKERASGPKAGADEEDGDRRRRFISQKPTDVVICPITTAVSRGCCQCRAWGGWFVGAPGAVGVRSLSRICPTDRSQTERRGYPPPTAREGIMTRIVLNRQRLSGRCLEQRKILCQAGILVLGGRKRLRDPKAAGRHFLGEDLDRRIAASPEANLELGRSGKIIVVF